MFPELLLVAALNITGPVGLSKNSHAHSGCHIASNAFSDVWKCRQLRRAQVAAMVLSPETGFVAVTMRNGLPDVVEDRDHNMIAHVDYARARITEPGDSEHSGTFEIPLRFADGSELPMVFQFHGASLKYAGIRIGIPQG